MLEAIQVRHRPHLHSFNQQRFTEEPGTVLSAEDPPQVKTEENTLHRVEDTVNKYRKSTTGLLPVL